MARRGVDGGIPVSAANSNPSVLPSDMSIPKRLTRFGGGVGFLRAHPHTSRSPNIGCGTIYGKTFHPTETETLQSQIDQCRIIPLRSTSRFPPAGDVDDRTLSTISSKPNLLRRDLDFPTTGARHLGLGSPGVTSATLAPIQEMNVIVALAKTRTCHDLAVLSTTETPLRDVRWAAALAILGHRRNPKPECALSLLGAGREALTWPMCRGSSSLADGISQSNWISSGESRSVLASERSLNRNR